MANNVYIGMRYVPIFDGAWDATKSYEPLVIVEYGNNTYTSKKPVPVGTLPTNTTYWALTGNYNGQISNLQSQINDTNDDVSALQTKENDDYSFLLGLHRRKYLFIGDSYGANPRVNTTWCAEAAAVMHLDSTDWENLCVSGANWTHATKPYIKQLQDYAGNRSQITDIVLCAGVNDIGLTFNDIQGAMETMATYVKTQYPNAKVWLGWCGFGIGKQGTGNAYIAYEAYKACGVAGFASIDNLIVANHNYSRLEDNAFHPDATACKTIGWAVANALRGGTYQSSMFNGNYPWEAVNYGGLAAIGGTITQQYLNAHAELDNYIFDLRRMLANYTTHPAFNSIDTGVALAYTSATFSDWCRPTEKFNHETPGYLTVSANGSNWSVMEGTYYLIWNDNDSRLELFFAPRQTPNVTSPQYVIAQTKITIPLISC